MSSSFHSSNIFCRKMFQEILCLVKLDGDNFHFHCFLGGGVGRRVKFEEYAPHCPGNPRTAFLVMVFLACRTKFQCHIFRLLYPPLSSLSFGVTKSRLEDSLKFLQTYSQVSASNMTFGYKVLTLPDSRT